MKLEFTVKKFAILMLVLILLFVPTYIAIANYYNTRNRGANAEENTYLVIRDPKNQSNEIRQEDTDRWNLFDSMIRNGYSVASIPDSVNRDENMLLAVYITESDKENAEPTQKQYAFYFSTDKSNCYFMDPDKKIFRIAENDVASFLADEAISSFLYRTSATPVLTVLGTRIKPAVLNWNYLTAGNAYQSLNESSDETITLDYVSGADFTVSFDNEPTRCTVKIVSSDGVLYDGSYKNMIPISDKRNKLLTVEIEADWTKDSNRDSYGTISYVLYADLSAPAQFGINSREINLGDFAVISALNVKDPTKILFSSVPALPYQPVFYSTGDSTVSALIPISYGCTQGTYSIAVSYGAVNETFSLNVMDYKYGYKESALDISDNLVKNYYTETNLNAYDKLVEDICRKDSCAAMFSGKFLDYQPKNVLDPKGCTNKLGFGRNVTINKDSTKSFQHTGIDLSVSSDTPLDVPAMNNGKICAVGNDAILGKYVVIDHGCSLRTWYAHLLETTAAVGATVAKGDAIGKIAAKGCTGFTQEGRIHVGMTIGNQPVALYSVWENGVILPDFSKIN